MREKENRRLGFDMTLTCTRKGEIYRREERGERREERGERKEIKWALTSIIYSKDKITRSPQIKNLENGFLLWTARYRINET